MKTIKTTRNGIILLIFLSFPLFGKNYILNNINVNGLKKTRLSSVLDITNLEKGMEVNEKSVEEVQQKLLEAGIFQSDLTVELAPVSDSSADIVINLAERWTLIPLPVGFVSTDKWLLGAVIIESNLAGLNQTLVGGSFFSNENNLGFLAWNNPFFMKSPYSLGISTSFFNGLTEQKAIDDSVLASYQKAMVSFRISMGRSFNHGWELEADSGIMYLKASEGTNYLSDDITGNFYMQGSFTTTWKNLKYTGFFYEGSELSLKNSLLYNFLEPELQPSVEFSMSHSFIIKNRHLIKWGFNSGWQDLPDYIPLQIGGTEGSRILPQGDIAVKYYTTGFAGFEPVLFKPSWGMFTLPVYYESGLYNPLKSDDQVFWHGPGLGFRFYVDKVAIPALGADFTWDLEHNLFRVTVSAGGPGG